jgi:hypothetical protein
MGADSRSARDSDASGGEPMRRRSLSRKNQALWYSVRAAMLRHQASKPRFRRARTVLLYNACQCDWLGDRAREADELAEEARQPTLH